MRGVRYAIAGVGMMPALVSVAALAADAERQLPLDPRARLARVAPGQESNRSLPCARAHQARSRRSCRSGARPSAAPSRRTVVARRAGTAPALPRTPSVPNKSVTPSDSESYRIVAPAPPAARRSRTPMRVGRHDADRQLVLARRAVRSTSTDASNAPALDAHRVARPAHVHGHVRRRDLRHGRARCAPAPESPPPPTRPAPARSLTVTRARLRLAQPDRRIRHADGHRSR